MLMDKLRKFLWWALDLKRVYGTPYSGLLGDLVPPGLKTTIDTTQDQLDTYCKIAWVSACVDAISRDVSRQKYYFKNKTGRYVDIAKLPDGLSQMFSNADPHLSIKNILTMAMSNLILSGNAILIPSTRTAYGKLKGVKDSLFPVSSNRVKILVSEDGDTLVGYQIRDMLGMEVIYRPAEVFHIMQSPISSPFIGVGNIQKLKLTAEGVISSQSMYNDVMDRKATPSMVIVDKNPDIDVNELERRRQLVESAYQGKNNTGKIMMVHGDITVQVIPLSNVELQSAELKDFDRAAIFSVMGVPPIVVGVPNDANRASAGTMLAVYYQNAVNPAIDLVESSFNSWLQNNYPGFTLEWDRYKTADVDTVTKLLNNGVISPNRAAELLGEETDYKDPSRSEYYISSALAPLSLIGSIYAPQGESPTVVEPSKGLSVKRPPKPFQMKWYYKALQSRRALEGKVTASVCEFFKSEYSRIVAKLPLPGLAMKASEIDDVFDSAEETQRLSEILIPAYRGGIRKAIKDVSLLSGTSVLVSSVSGVVETRSNLLASKITRITNETQKQVRSIILESLRENEDIVATQTRLGEYFTEFGEYRSRMIARTEMRAAWDIGAQYAYQEIGVTKVDVVGCEDEETDCNREGVAIDEIDALDFHPNHRGAIVPAEEV